MREALRVRSEGYVSVRVVVLWGQEGLCNLFLVLYHSGQDHFIS